MDFATIADQDEIINLYKEVIDKVNQTTVKLGWNISKYPNEDFVKTAILNHEMCVFHENEVIIAAAVVNHRVNSEYDDIKWEVNTPKDKIATIHALAVAPTHRGKKISDIFLNDIENYCEQNGDIAIHLDVIDTNIPAYKLYSRNGYKEVDCIEMFYEVVGIRKFWMMEHVL